MVKLNDISSKSKVYPNLSKINYRELCNSYNPNVREIIDMSMKEKYEFEKTLTNEKVKSLKFYDKYIAIPYKYKNTKRIVSFNIHNFKNYCSSEKPMDLNPHKTLFEKIKSDIICFQELIPLKDKKEDLETYNFKKFTDTMNDLGYKHHNICNANYGKSTIINDECYYLLANGIVSQEPFKYKTNYGLVGNRCVNVVITSDNKLLFNVHLEYTDKYKTIEKMREKQINELIDIIKKEQKKHKIDEIILCGDLNNDYKLNYKLLKPLFDLFVKHKNFNTTYEKKQIDYILTTKDFKYKMNNNVIKTCLSDHHPIFMDYSDKIDKNLKQKMNFENLFIKHYEKLVIDKKYVSYKPTNLLNDSLFVSEKNEWFGLKSKVKPLKTASFKTFLYNLSSNYPHYKKHNIKDEIYYENFLLQYFKTLKNLKTIVLWPESEFYYKSSDKLKKLFDKLKNNGTIYYTKDLKLNFSEAQNLIFQLYIHTDRNKTISHINYNTNQKGWKNTKYRLPIKVIFYEYEGDQKDISKSNAKFKDELRNIFLTGDKRTYDILHINDTFQEAIDNSSLFLNQNSIKLLSKLNIFHLLRNTNDLVLNTLNSIKKILYNNFDLLDINRFIFNSSIVLYTHGMREFNDLDGYVYNENASKEFKELYKNYFHMDSKHRHPYIDISAPNTPLYEEYITKFYDKVANMLDIPDYDTVIFDPHYHYYFFGLKINILELEIIKKIYRYKPKSYADLIALDIKFKLKLKFPEIPDKIKYYYKDKIDKEYIYKATKNYLRTLYGIKLSNEEIDKYFTKMKISSDVENFSIQDNKDFFDKIIR